MSTSAPASCRAGLWLRLGRTLRYPDTAGADALVAVWAAAMRCGLFLGQMIWIDDFPRQAYGLRAYNADMLRAGQFPLWTSSL